mgnify:CR=1 FL=1|tara:strand:+ start:239 stop:574 length:336 start_codon:yes stop_codon:yes gene_type:complete
MLGKISRKIKPKAKSKAQVFKDDEMNELLINHQMSDATLHQQEILTEQLDDAFESLKAKGFILEDPMQDAALLGALALLAGGGVGRATAPQTEEELMQYQTENPGQLMVRY